MDDKLIPMPDLTYAERERLIHSMLMWRETLRREPERNAEEIAEISDLYWKIQSHF
jgi:hypothetical protein